MEDDRDDSAAPSILILFSDTGGGHRSVARALEEGFRALAPGVRVALLDPLLGQESLLVHRLASLYPALVRSCRPGWALIYHATDSRPAIRLVSAGLGASVRRSLVRHLRAADPDLVVSVHPLLCHLAAAAIRTVRRTRPLVTVVTEHVAVHAGWASPMADLVSVATAASRETMVRLGVPHDRVRVVGLPVDVRFRPPRPGERAAERMRLGLRVDMPTLLIAAGGDGAGGLQRVVLALAGRPQPWQVIVVCGRNERLRERLARLRLATLTRVMGFVDTMQELVRGADLLVTKAGSVSIAEAQASGLPVAITHFLPGQEAPNVRFVVEAGFGLYEPQPARLLQAVSRLVGTASLE